jgi:hypothetical protein
MRLPAIPNQRLQGGFHPAQLPQPRPHISKPMLGLLAHLVTVIAVFQPQQASHFVQAEPQPLR